MMRTLAVMPGTSSRFALGVSTTTMYVTTFWTVWAALRIWRTRPSNVRPENASTVNVTRWSWRILPMSDSSIATSTCICRRSCAIVNSVGVFEARRHRLAGIDLAGDHYAVDGRADRGLREIVARRRERRLALLHDRRGVGDLRIGRLGLRIRGADRLGGAALGEARLVDLRARDEPFLDQRLLAVEVALRIVVGDLRAQHLGALRRGVALLLQIRGTRGLEVRLRLPHADLVGLGIDTRQQLSLLHRRVEVDEQLLDLARDLRSDEHRRHGVERAGRRHHRRDVAALHLGHAELRTLRARAVALPCPVGEGGDDERRQEGPAEPAEEGCGGRRQGDYLVVDRGRGSRRVGADGVPSRQPGRPRPACCISSISERILRRRVSTTDIW